MAGYDTLLAYLDEHGIPYELEEHAPAFTAQEIAAVEHVPGRMFAKVVMVEADDRLLMLVLPASHRIDTDRVARLVDAREVRLARESEFESAFGDCEVGAMPPFGNLYHLPVFVDQALTEDERIVFQAGTHTKTIGMRYEDFARLVEPGVGEFAISPRMHAHAGRDR